MCEEIPKKSDLLIKLEFYINQWYKWHVLNKTTFCWKFNISNKFEIDSSLKRNLKRIIMRLLITEAEWVLKKCSTIFYLVWQFLHYMKKNAIVFWFRIRVYMNQVSDKILDKLDRPRCLRWTACKCSNMPRTIPWVDRRTGHRPKKWPWLQPGSG